MDTLFQVFWFSGSCQGQNGKWPDLFKIQQGLSCFRSNEVGNGYVNSQDEEDCKLFFVSMFHFGQIPAHYTNRESSRGPS